MRAQCRKSCRRWGAVKLQLFRGFPKETLNNLVVFLSMMSISDAANVWPNWLSSFPRLPWLWFGEIIQCQYMFKCNFFVCVVFWVIFYLLPACLCDCVYSFLISNETPPTLLGVGQHREAAPKKPTGAKHHKRFLYRVGQHSSAEELCCWSSILLCSLLELWMLPERKSSGLMCSPRVSRIILPMDRAGIGVLLLLNNENQPEIARSCPAQGQVKIHSEIAGLDIGFGRLGNVQQSVSFARFHFQKNWVLSAEFELSVDGIWKETYP